MAERAVRFDFTAKDNVSKTFDKVADKSDHLSRTLGKIGKVAAVALAGTAVAGIGAFAVALKNGVKDAAEFETLAKKTAAVLKSTGNAANTSVKGIQRMAGELENLSGVDETLIINSQNVLATFTKVRNEVGKGNKIFDRATEAALNMSVALGTDLQGATIQIGKALQDPLKGLTALGRAGVIFTKEQKEQIKTLVESGRVMDAQKVILAELSKEFGGAAKAAGSGFEGSMARAKDAVQDLFRGVGTMLLPVIADLAQWLSGKVVPALEAFFGGLQGQGKMAGFSGAINTLGLGLRGLYLAFKDGDVTSDGFVGAMERVGAAVGGIVKFVRDTIPRVKVEFGKIKTAFATMLDGVDFSAAARNLFESAKTWAGSLISGVQTGIDTGDWGPLGKTIGEKVAQAVQGAGALAGKIGSALGELLKKVDWVGIGISVGKQIPSLMVGLAAGILSFDLAGLLKGLAANWQAVLFAILAVALAPASWIAKIGGLLAKIPFVGTFLKWGLDQFKRVSDWLVGGAIQLVNSFGRGFMQGLGFVMPKVASAFLKTLRALPTYARVLALELWERAVAMMAGFGAAIGRGVVTVGKAIARVPVTILRAFSGAGSWLVSAGGAVITGFITGINNRLGALWAKVTSITDGIKRRLAEALKIGSPSKVTVQYGRWITEGLAVGMEKSMGRVERAAGSLAASAMPGLAGSPAMATAGASAAGMGRGGGGGGTTIIQASFPHYVGDKSDLVRAIDDLRRTGRLP